MHVLFFMVVTLPVFQLEMFPLKEVACKNTVEGKGFGNVYYLIIRSKED